jgi:hypothetical protein
MRGWVRAAYDLATMFVMPRYGPVNRRGTENQETRIAKRRTRTVTGVPVV